MVAKQKTTYIHMTFVLPRDVSLSFCWQKGGREETYPSVGGEGGGREETYPSVSEAKYNIHSSDEETLMIWPIHLLAGRGGSVVRRRTPLLAAGGGREATYPSVGGGGAVVRRHVPSQPRFTT